MSRLRCALSDLRSPHRDRTPFRRPGFTLIELLVVVGILAVISAILLPIMIQVRDKARQAAARSEAEQDVSRPAFRRASSDRQALPAGSPPIVDMLDLDMTLTSSYHRIAMDVFTRYRVDCAGTVVFRYPGGTKDGRVLLAIPFPDNTLEARDVELTVLRPGSDEPLPLNDVLYNKEGIYYACTMSPDQTLTAKVRFTALGREQFDYTLPPARQLRAVAITLNMPGGQSRTLPDDSLQPSASGPEQIRWEFKNLVSDRRITVLIPGAQAPLARMLLLSRLVGLAVLLFGAGFLYLSEQAKPGQLDSFRWAHFLLLALTYSLFFVIFAVLEFDGRLGTPAAMALSALFSLPLLVLHVSRVLNIRFAITRVVPLALFTLGLVINGVYGAAARDYVFLGAVIFLMAYVTIFYPSWSEGRDRYRREQEAAYSARRSALVARITKGLGAQMAELKTRDARAARSRRTASGEEGTAVRTRLERAREPVDGLEKEYEDLTKRLSYLPDERMWQSDETCSALEQKANAFEDRLEPVLASLQSELDIVQSLLKSRDLPARDGEIHCLTCGHVVPDAPFCQNCGSPRPLIVACGGCGQRVILPVHLLAEGEQDRALFCTRCGLRLPSHRMPSDAADPAGEADRAAEA